MSKYFEKSLIFLAKHGSEDALTYIYKKYVKEIHYYFFKRIKTKEDANDLTQDVFIAFIDTLDKYRGEAGIRTYLYSIAKNILFDHYKDNNKIIYDTKYIESIKDEDIKENTTDNDLLLTNLNNIEKDVLERKVILKERHKDIAKRLGISIDNSRQLLRRAIIKIRKTSNG